jgi:hypothetical protein
VSDDNEISLTCPSCNTIGHYAKGLIETFGKVRCSDCNGNISLVPYKATEHLKEIRKKASQQRNEEWANQLAELWEYIIRNRNEIHGVDHQFLLETCVDLFLNGVTFIPGYEFLDYEEKSIIESLLTEKFNPTPYLPPNTPDFESPLWKRMFVAHYKVLEGMLRPGEGILLIDEGTVKLGKGNRSRNGTIILTNMRLIVIGREHITADHQVQSYPHYSKIRNYNIETYKIRLGKMKEGNWRYLITPQPQSAMLYASIDYFSLEQFTKIEMKKKSIECKLHDFEYTDIKPREYYVPTGHVFFRPVGWVGFKLEPGQNRTKGPFTIEIILGGLTISLKDKSELISRHKGLAKVLQDAVDDARQPQPALQ